MTDTRLPGWYAALAGKGLAGALGIELVELTPERVVATMPVDDRTRQPFGILHGGASIALAETVASFGAVMRIDHTRFVAVGQEINGNHLRGKSEGVVTATATPIHIGRSSHVWNIEIVDEQGRLVCISRCTMAIVEKRQETGPSVEVDPVPQSKVIWPLSRR
jgi:1,4-dihydroxy-2-naphthoyl-CoA hydrolase